MAKNQVEKLIDEAIDTKGTYAEFIVSPGNLAFICDGGLRRSTRNYKVDDKAIIVIERALKRINERSILFTGSLRRIRVLLKDGREAEFVRSDNGNICNVTGKRFTEKNQKEYCWARFTSESDERCGVAFEITRQKNKNQIQPCKGSILNGAFDSGISTDLRFVMCGDFYGKSEIPDSKYADRNEAASKKVAGILETAIRNMLHMNLLSMSLFSTLPSSIDEETEINMEMMEAVRRACASHPMFRTRVGTIVGKSKIIFGTNEVTRLFTQEMINHLFKDKYWIEQCDEGSREEYFLIDIGIPYYDREKFMLTLFADDNMDELSEILATQRDKWLRDFYIFCSEPIAEEKTRRKVVTALNNMKSIRDSKGKMHFPCEISINLSDEDTTNKSVVVKNSLIYPGGKADEHSEQIQNFFLNYLGIGGFSRKPEMEDLANDLMKKRQPIDRLYCDRLLTLAKYDEENRGEIDFSKYAIFPYESARGLKRVKACELVIGKPYIKERNLLASALNRETLWKGFKKILKAEELQDLIEFAICCGAVGKAKIVRQKAEKHICFSETLFASGKQGNRDSNYDYTIPGLEEMLRRRSLQLSRLIWSAILEVEEPSETLYAEYSVDNRKTVNRDDSSLIRILRAKSWVPGKDGKFYMPGNIAITDISDDLLYNRRNPILKQLQFGAGIKEKEKNLADMKKLAEREGLRLISEEEYLEFMKWKESSRKRKK